MNNCNNEMNKDFQKILINGDNTNFSDNQFTNKQNKQNNINKQNQTIIKKYPEPKRLTEAEQEALKKLTMRPHLKDRVGEYIECCGYVVGNYREMSDRFTVINLIDLNNNCFAADHVQIDFKQNIYDYRADIGHFVTIRGYVKEYPKNNNTDYTIDITEKIEPCISNFILINNAEQYIDLTEQEVKLIYKLLSRNNITKTYNLIELVRKKINDKIELAFMKDFLYHYTICQYFLNQAVYKMYEGELRDQGFNDYIALDILYILCNVYYQLTITNDISLYNSLFTIVQSCNVIQNIHSYKSIEDNPNFNKFCKEKLNINLNSRKHKKIWDNFIIWRKYNFADNEPNVYNWNIDYLITTTYKVIKSFM